MGEETQALAVLPTGEQVLMFFPDKGDVVCWPVELALVSGPSSITVGPEAVRRPPARASRAAALEPASIEKANWQLTLASTSQDVVGRVEWEGDLEAL